MDTLLGLSERIKRILALASFAATVLSLLSLRERASCTSPISLSIPILMYHHVGDWGESRADWAPWVVRSTEFRAQMDWLVANGFHTITFRELLAGQKRENRCQRSRSSFHSMMDGRRKKAWCAPSWNHEDCMLCSSSIPLQ